MTELNNEDGIKIEDQVGTLVASMDIADDDKRTIILKYMPDGTIAIDCENDPELVAKYQEQINAIIEQNRRPLVRPLPSLKDLFFDTSLGKAFAKGTEPKRYSPCVDCGNPAKGGQCFKCQQKKRSA